MELQSSESKKLFKVFDASKRKRSKKKREGPDDANSLATDDSNSACPTNVGRIESGKGSLHHVPALDGEGLRNSDSAARDRSTHSIPREEHRSPRRHRRAPREGLSLALKAGTATSPRSISPLMGADASSEHPTQDHDSLIYAYLEEAIKRDKKKDFRHRHGRRHDEQRGSRDHDHDRDRERNRDRARDRDRERDRERDRDPSGSREHRHRHRRHRSDLNSRDREKRQKESPSPEINQAVLLETFAKICAQMNEKSHSPVTRTQSHKSLQCEVPSGDLYNCDRPDRLPERLDVQTHGVNTPTRIRSQGNCRQTRSREIIQSRHDKCDCCFDEPKMQYEKEPKYASKIDYGAAEAKYSSKIEVNRSRAVVNRINEDERYRNYRPAENVATRTCIGTYRDRQRDREYRDIERRQYEDERRRYVEQKTSRSFDTHREGYEEERCRRTSRSDTKDKRFDDKYYDKTMIDVPRHFPKDTRARRPEDRDIRDRFDRNSVASREEYRERDRYSERERDSGLSVADGETSTMSGRTNKSTYMKAVKQEIAEQREAMDKMMKLWKELMRCFKGISQTQDKDKTMNETACENVRESAAAQLRLWRECMRRYETVARDVGDTDARLMEEINKQRSEMSEMATMWQECLQRYRDMSNDFNTLKQQLAAPESPTRLPAPGASPLVCSEGERPPPVPVYRMPQNYSQIPTAPGAGYCVGSPLRGRASAPPAWWWGGEHPPARQRSSRRSSPESRDGRDTDRDRRHRNKEPRDVPRYKEKSSKPSAARSEHRRRKR